MSSPSVTSKDIPIEGGFLKRTVRWLDQNIERVAFTSDPFGNYLLNDLSNPGALCIRQGFGYERQFGLDGRAFSLPLCMDDVSGSADYH